jgi:hypothetical protein
MIAPSRDMVLFSGAQSDIASQRGQGRRLPGFCRQTENAFRLPIAPYPSRPEPDDWQTSPTRQSQYLARIPSRQFIIPKHRPRQSCASDCRVICPCTARQRPGRQRRRGHCADHRNRSWRYDTRASRRRPVHFARTGFISPLSPSAPYNFTVGQASPSCDPVCSHGSCLKLIGLDRNDNETSFGPPYNRSLPMVWQANLLAYNFILRHQLEKRDSKTGSLPIETAAEGGYAHRLIERPTSQH